MNVLPWRDLAACRDIVSADYDPFFADNAELQGEALDISVQRARCAMPA